MKNWIVGVEKFEISEEKTYHFDGVLSEHKNVKEMTRVNLRIANLTKGTNPIFGLFLVKMKINQTRNKRTKETQTNKARSNK